MAHRTSAVKRLRQSTRARLRNKTVKSRLRTEENKFERIVGRGDLGAATAQFSLLTKLFQQAAARNIIHVNLAARRQAQLQRKLSDLKAAPGG